jgi:hypothetical protein
VKNASSFIEVRLVVEVCTDTPNILLGKEKRKTLPPKCTSVVGRHCRRVNALGRMIQIQDHQGYCTV